MSKRVAVIGGGASGLMAACFAAEAGCSVAIFEKQGRLGRKILVSGNGRCNITNRFIDPARYHGSNPRFAQEVLTRFGFEETKAFFESIGIPLVEEKKGRLFPASLHAATVVRFFEYELLRRGVDVHLHRKVEHISPKGNAIEIVTAGREAYRVDAVILAAGSCAHPPAGGSRSGYELALQAGHRVIEPFPAIIPITIPMKDIHRLQGIKWQCGVRVEENGKITASSQGEVLFTAYGISGPASLDVSRAVNESVIKGGAPRIVIDCMPHRSHNELDAILSSLFADPGKSVSFALSSLLRHPMPDVLLSRASLSKGVTAGEMTPDMRRRLVGAIKGLSLEPGAPRGFNEAVVAAGGVDVSEVNPATMASRIMPGLYLTGELLDIDGDSGGYNLQFAWSTGAIAGTAQAATVS